MPRKKTPCPGCGQPKWPESAMCRACSDGLRAEVSPRRCSACGGPKSFYAETCRSCKDGSLIERLVGKIDFTDDCWLWTGAASRGAANPYPSFRVGADVVRVHRYVYEQFVEKIPEGLDLDHLCRNTLCVNPDHVEPVTNTENRRRAVALRAAA